MPWIKQEDCIGCGICEKSCIVNAITIENKKAYINQDKCIKCGVCHSVCPRDAVRHDSERIIFDIANNIQWVKNLLEHYDTESERKSFMGRIRKHFNKEKIVIEKTIEELNSIDIHKST